ncbi:MAG TPA: AEC family transporter [Candidatus Stercoripulliclostridium merdipullorum]|uniref:AEC family transporter n=1 Tax=Candidatus Stercoripulliclostridium merdipullorum TaxID=2840952 RepID=A0A9D1NCS4_9FIRM|nr:AEC family transporter [Candidatus Stercoripulliclostridium merdipullorum]
MFTVTLVTVAVMLAYAVPGYLLSRFRAVKEEAIPAFAKVLMYVCQPCLTLYAFDRVEYSVDLLKEIGIFFAVTLLAQLIAILLFYAVVKGRGDDVAYRVSAVAAAFGNCAFMGVPLVEAALPDAPRAVLMSAIFFLTMSLLGWTLASYLITRNKRFVSVKSIFLNPSVLILVVALPLFFTHTKLPSTVASAVEILGKMTTPLCMLIMGMRLAHMSPRALIGRPVQYAAIGVKLIVFPLAVYGIAWLMPVALYLKQTLLLLSACPVASVVLNFAEMHGAGQENAANVVLVSTGLSLLTIPLLSLLL